MYLNTNFTPINILKQRYLDLGIYYGAGLSEAALSAKEHEFVVGGGNSAGSSMYYGLIFFDIGRSDVKGPVEELNINSWQDEERF